jgi:xanthine dehydrogenase accessory factor
MKLMLTLAAEPAVLVAVDATQGSVPRETGAWMAVTATHVIGTIGGGHLELQAIRAARARLLNPQITSQITSQITPQSPQAEEALRYVLGPSLGQCCGGVVVLRYTLLPQADEGDFVNVAQRAALQKRLQTGLHPLALFGGGHVGHALVQVLANLPFAVRWIDSRDEIFPTDGLPETVECEHSDPVQAAVADLAPGSRVLIMSFSHAEDLDVVAACLLRQRERHDLPYVGLIGSKTKWATFRHRLTERGFTDAELAHITCPIGVPGVVGKEPEVIAVAVAAQLLQSLS